MAKLYGKLKALKKSSESKPVVALTKQKWTDYPFIIRGKEEGIPVWRYILVPPDKIDDLKSQQPGQTINCNKFGRTIEYTDDNGQTCTLSGWGTDPPQSITTWVNKHYVWPAIDEKTDLKYINDDIRLCIIQRITPSQLIGIYRYYHKQDHFHYIRLFDDFQSSLAYRSGIRNFDRFICLNGINIEQDTLDQVTKRFKNELHLPVEMLVCSPATYEYYKSNNILLHCNLPTVQHLKPVFDISLSNENTFTSINDVFKQNFCVIQWENSNNISIVSQSSIFKSSDFIHVNDICFVEIEERQYQKGQIIFKGLQDQCQNFQSHFIKRLTDDSIDRYYYESNDNKLISEENLNTKISSDKIILEEKIQLEDLPNELLYDLFSYIKVEDLYNGFNNLNYRFNNLLLSRNNVSLIYNENTDPLLIKLYGFEINHLTIDTSNQCDLSQFFNLHSLILCNRNSNHIKQIRPEIVPNLIYLSFLLKSDLKLPFDLVNDIFSNRFPYLYYVNLGHIDKHFCQTWSISPSLKIVSLYCDKLIIIPDILSSCPNLNHLQLHILYNTNTSIVSCRSFTHSLQRFTLWSEEFELTYDLIDSLLSYVPNVRRLYLQTKCRILFIELIKNIIKKLDNLSRFDCFIKELLIKNDRIYNLNDIYQISSCFNRIKCIKENDYFRIFSTE